MNALNTLDQHDQIAAQEKVVAERLDGYRLFTTVFLELPSEEFVASVLNASLADDEIESSREIDAPDGLSILREWALQARTRDQVVVLQDVAKDRAWLLRNVSSDGPRPPYESAYTESDAGASIAALNILFAGEGYLLAESIHETPDYIGVEMSFMQTLCEKQLQALQQGNADEAARVLATERAFWQSNLGAWARDFADETFKYARTNFYRALALMLQEFVQLESAVLAE